MSVTVNGGIVPSVTVSGIRQQDPNSSLGAVTPTEDDTVTLFKRHIHDHNNPHNVTAGQVGTYTSDEIDGILVGTVPLDIIQDSVDAAISVHTSDYNNPHQTTAAQVGAYTVGQTDSAISASTGGFTSALSSHTTNTLNPHNTTATQVGAYTTAQTNTLVANTLTNYATTTAVANTLTNYATTSLVSAHTTNTLNPHNTTATQVGAYTRAQVDGLISGITEARVNVMNFGAIGNGIHDDTVNIQDAINSLPVGNTFPSSAVGGVVYLPAGTYLTTSPIDQSASVELQGDSRYSTRINYTPTITPVTSIMVSDGGSGYLTTAPSVVVTGHDGNTSCTATAVLETGGGSILSISVDNQGSGYTSATVTVTQSANTSCTADVVVYNGKVVQIDITNAGSNYTPPGTPIVVTITGDGSNAAATATVKTVGVASIAVSDGGDGYTLTPTVTISGGGGTGAEGIAHITSAINASSGAIRDIFIKTYAGDGIGTDASGLTCQCERLLIDAASWGIYLPATPTNTYPDNSTYSQACIFKDMRIAAGCGVLWVAGNANIIDGIDGEIGPNYPSTFPPFAQNSVQDLAPIIITGWNNTISNCIIENLHNPNYSTGFYFCGGQSTIINCYYESSTENSIMWKINNSSFFNIDTIQGLSASSKLKLTNSHNICITSLQILDYEPSQAFDLDNNSDVQIGSLYCYGGAPLLDHPNIKIGRIQSQLGGQTVDASSNPTSRNLLVNGDFLSGTYLWETDNAAGKNNLSGATYSVVEKNTLPDSFAWPYAYESSYGVSPSSYLTREAGKAMKVSIPTGLTHTHVGYLKRTEDLTIPTHMEESGAYLGCKVINNSPCFITLVVNNGLRHPLPDIGATAVRIPSLGTGSGGTAKSQAVNFYYEVAASVNTIYKHIDSIGDPTDLTGYYIDGIAGTGSDASNIVWSGYKLPDDDSFIGHTVEVSFDGKEWNDPTKVWLYKEITGQSVDGSGNIKFTVSPAFGQTTLGARFRILGFTEISTYNPSINFTLFETQDHYVYFKFNNVNLTNMGIYLNIQTAATGSASPVVQIWSDSGWDTCTVDSDGTSGFTTSGFIKFSYSSTWQWKTMLGTSYNQSGYWIRIHSSANLTTPPTLKTALQAGSAYVVGVEPKGDIYLSDVYVVTGNRHNTVPETTAQMVWIDPSGVQTKQLRNSTTPTLGTWTKGDIIWNTLDTTTAFAGWICKTAGTGTNAVWTTFGAIT